MSEQKPVLLTGVKPTGEMHIGNYFGAIRQLVELSKEGKYRVFVMLADYHALNFIQDSDEMRRLTRELILTYLAAGLDSKEVTLFKQSDVPAHTELAWIFDTITTVPYLMRAHAYKDAEAKGREVSVGTFNYPMLMAADILLYDAAVVPVGEDQRQHVEYARDTAEKFNRTFKTEVFKLPEARIMPEVAVVPGTDGQKMSKSYGNTIPLFASRDELAKCVMGIVTDSSGERPENVYALHRLVKRPEELEGLYAEKKGNYKALKEALIEDLERLIAPMRERRAAISDEDVTHVLEAGKKIARAVSEAKMAMVRKAVGVA